MNVSMAWVRTALLLVVALILDDKLAPEMLVLGARPELVVPAVLLATLRFGPASGAWAGFTCGLFLDVATPEDLGARALALAVAAFATGRVAGQLDVAGLPVQLLLIAILGTIDGAIYQAASHLTDPARGFALFFTRQLPSVLYTVILMAPVLLTLGRRLVPLRASWRESG